MSNPITSLAITYSNGKEQTVTNPTVLKATQDAMDSIAPKPISFTVKNIDVKDYSLRGDDAAKRIDTFCPDVWDNPRHAGPTGSADDGPPKREGSIRCIGGLNVFENLQLRGNDGGILLGSERKGMPVIHVTNVFTDDGVALIRAQGAKEIIIKNYGSSKPSWAYPVSLFTDQVDVFRWDNSEIPRTSKYFWLRQGYRNLNGKPNGEGVVRWMWGHDLYVKGINLMPADLAHEFKQDDQDRSGGHKGDTSSVHVHEQCELPGSSPVQIGWMGGGPDANKGDHWLGLSKWINCKFGKEPQINAGVGHVEYKDCAVGDYDPVLDVWKNLKKLNKVAK